MASLHPAHCERDGILLRNIISLPSIAFATVSKEVALQKNSLKEFSKYRHLR